MNKDLEKFARGGIVMPNNGGELAEDIPTRLTPSCRVLLNEDGSEVTKDYISDGMLETYESLNLGRDYINKEEESK